MGQSSGSLKLRYNNHKNAFRNIDLRADTELSNYIWDLKTSNKSFHIQWRKILQEQPYSKISKKCKLCSREKVEILKAKKASPGRVLNSRTGILGPCLHRNKHLLGKVNTNRGNIIFKEIDPQNLLGEKPQNYENLWGTIRSGKSWRDKNKRNDSELPILDNG